MKCLSIQIQANVSDAFSVEDVLYASRQMGRFPEVDSDEGQSDHVNLNYFTEELPVLWGDLKNTLYGENAMGAWLKKTSIVVCEGDTGWDDYLLLHHFDQGESTDTI